MTNAQIIMNQAVALMEQGIIGTTGRELVAELPDGSKKVFMEPEPIHTFGGWKERGFRVRKGEHAVARFAIWKYAKAQKAEDDEEQPIGGKMFIKTACWFSKSQVEEMGA